MPAFIAANYGMNYYCEHNICPMKTKYPVTTDTLQISRDLHMEQVAALTGIDMDAVRALNPQYRTDVIPGSVGNMSLCLTTEALNALIDLTDSVYNYRADELLTRRATVSVPEVASTHRTSTSASRSSQTSGRAKSSQKASRKSKTKQRAQTTTVRSGDTLSDIAKRNHTTVKKLRQLNGIKGNLINIGQKIRVK